MQFRLRYGAHDIELPPGEFVIGRGEECQLALDDSLVSRRHVALRVSSSRLIVVDLGSRNGITVNNERVRGERLMANGDVLGVGSHKLIVQLVRTEAARRRLSTQTLQAVKLSDIDPVAAAAAEAAKHSSAPPGGGAGRSGSGSSGSGSSGSGSSGSGNYAKLLTLATLADKALTLGRLHEAERLIATPLRELAVEASQGGAVPAAVLERASLVAIKWAIATNNVERLLYVFAVHASCGALLSGSVIEEMHAAVRKLNGVGVEDLDSYLERIRNRADTPAEKFVLSRIEGLRSLITR